MSTSSAEIPVVWEDQEKINTFGKLNTRAIRLKNDLLQKKREHEIVSDQLDEWILIDDDDDTAVKFRYGETFVSVSKEEAEQSLIKYRDTLSKEIDQLTGNISTCQDEMKILKIALYAKFKDQINLEGDASSDM